jgi:hypothetical protein
MLELLSAVNDGRNSFTAIVTSVFSGLLAASGLTRPRSGLRSLATGRGGPRVPDARITAIVDDLFLPLVTGTSRR